MMQRVTTDSPPHKYFTMMLNMAEDDLDPFQFRLLAHYIRWTGHGGTYEESLRQTAQKIKMSINTIQKALDELATLGYLAVKRPEPAEARRGKMIEVTVIDRWTENIARYAKSDEKQDKNNAVSNMTQPTEVAVSNMIQPPVSNMTRLEEQNTEEQEKNTAPKGATSSKDKEAEAISQYIKAYIDGLPEKPVKNQYNSRTTRADALAVYKGGYKPEHVTRYTAFLSAQNYWKGRKVPFSVIADGLPAWVANLPPQIAPDHPEPPPAAPAVAGNPDDPITPEQVEIMKAKLAQIAEAWAA